MYPYSHVLKWDDTESVSNLVTSLLRTRTSLRLSENQLQHIGSDLLSAFVFSAVNNTVDLSIEPVVYISYYVGPTIGSTVFNDTVVLDIPKVSHMVSKKNLFILIVESSLELPELPSSVNIETTATNESNDFLEIAENAFCRTVVEKCVAVGIGAIFCQRRIHPFLVKELNNRGIIAIPRVSIRFVSLIARLSGALLLGEFGSFLQADISMIARCIGYLESIEWKLLDTKMFLFVSSGPNNRPQEEQYAFETRKKAVSTLIICAPADDIGVELQLACQRSVKTLSHSLSNSKYLDGGGVWQNYSACQLMSSYLKSGPMKKYSIVPPELLLQHALAEYATLAGYDVSSDFSPTNSVAVIDCFPSNISALKTAVDCACCVLSIDGVVYAADTSEQLAHR